MTAAEAHPIDPRHVVGPVAGSVGATAFGPFEVRWREQGPAEGPITLLLHGVYAGASGYEWRRLAPLLAEEGRRVRIVDLLGIGISDRPDLDWNPGVLTSVVAALVRAAGPEVNVVASSLTGAHAVRAVGAGAPCGSLALITPTGLGRAQTSTSGALGRSLYAIGRHTPLGDAFVWALSSGPSVRWFQEHQTYRDPTALTDEEVDETRRIARQPNAKHLQLAFVTNRLGIRLDDEEVAAVSPSVLWGTGQGFVGDEEPDAWRAAGATVIEVAAGLPHVEDPTATAAWLAQVASAA